MKGLLKKIGSVMIVGSLLIGGISMSGVFQGPEKGLRR